MADNLSASYFELEAGEQSELLTALAPVMGRRAEILEKDIWLCQILGILFSLPCCKPMAFKGGTSLSKVYQAIERFSEDIDVTVDYRSLVADAPDLATLSSNSQRNKLSEALKVALNNHVALELVPALQNKLNSVLPTLNINIELSGDGEKMWLYYPSAVENSDAYLRPNILIEFGGRNATLPQELLTIAPDIAAHVPGLRFPVAQVAVLSPKRTFWEKATLIHVECHRTNLRAGADRMSRHWYDLARLADHVIGRQSVQDLELLKDVLTIKETFYRSGFSHYKDCLSGNLKLIPAEHILDSLRQDYQAMVDAQMLYGKTLAFDDIVARLKALEIEINQIHKSITSRTNSFA